MLDELTDDLEREGITLAIAHDIGQVRDMLATGHATPKLHIYPTVQDAIDDLNAPR